MPENGTQALDRASINAEIRSIAATAGLEQGWIDTQIDEEATADAARAAAFAAMQERSAQTATRTARAHVIFDHNDPQVIAQRAGEAIFARSHPDHQLSEPARQFAHMSLVDHARDSLRRSGVSISGMSADTIITRSLGGLHTTSDFPLILGDAAHREMRRAYEAAPSGARQLARQTTNRDFRIKHKLTLDEAPKLEKVNEAGEFKRGTIAEGRESYRIETFGKIWGASRQALINDDLGAFTDVPRKQGIAARAFENDFIVNLITSNPAMSDGVAVFHADHRNLTVDTPPDLLALDISAMDAARLAMRRQTAPGGMLIDVTPRFVLVPPELETTAEQVLSVIAATKTEDANPFSNLTLLVEPRLTDTGQFYIVADPATVDGLEFAYLEGAPGPQLETKVGFEVDGILFKVRLDFGGGWIDYRGWHRVN